MVLFCGRQNRLRRIISVVRTCAASSGLLNVTMTQPCQETKIFKKMRENGTNVIFKTISAAKELEKKRSI